MTYIHCAVAQILFICIYGGQKARPLRHRNQDILPFYHFTISQEMFTLFDLCEVCSDEENPRKFAEKHGLLKRKTPKCPDCDAEVAGPFGQLRL